MTHRDALRALEDEAAARRVAFLRACEVATESGLSKLEQLVEWSRDLSDHPKEWASLQGELYRLLGVFAAMERGESYEERRERLKPGEGYQVARDVRAELVAAAGKCRICGGTAFLEADHIIPRRRGGTNHRSNLQVLCRGCNSKKYTKTMTEWLGEGWEARFPQ